MQVVILCGGLGSRIREVNNELPKPLIPIGGKPILWHIMKHYSHYGFNDFVLCLGYKSDAIKRYFVDYHRNLSDFTIDLGHGGAVEVHRKPAAENWRVTLVETGMNAMTGCRVKRIEPYIKGPRFLLTYGDGVSNVALDQSIDFHMTEGRIGTVTAVPPPGRFGEIKVADGQVQQFMEKPTQSTGCINGGFFVFERSIFDWLRDDPTLVLEKEPLTQLSQAGELSAYAHDGFWHCMDNSRDYQTLNEMWDSGEAPWNCWDAAEPSAAVEHSRMSRGDAIRRELRLLGDVPEASPRQPRRIRASSSTKC